MSGNVSLDWENTAAEDLAVAKQCAPKKEGFLRYQALELLQCGYSQEEVARISDREVRSIRNCRSCKLTLRIHFGSVSSVVSLNQVRHCLSDRIAVNAHNVVGAVSPEQGELFSLVVPHSECAHFAKIRFPYDLSLPKRSHKENL